MEKGAIGIFDSGVGGLTVLKQVEKLLPEEEFIYFGDTLRVPYGNRKEEEIRAFSLEIVDFLMSKNIKALIVACNTIDSVAMESILKKVDIPVFGVIKSGSRLAVRISKNKKIGIIGTNRTIASQAYNREIEKSGNYEIFSLAIPEFVDLVESGEKEGIGKLIEEKLRPINESQIDTLVLGCTHFPVIQGEIEKKLRPGISLVDPAVEVAKVLRGMFQKDQGNEILASKKYYVSSDLDKFKEIGFNILGKKLENVEEVVL